MNFDEDVINYVKGELGYFGLSYVDGESIDDNLKKLFTIQEKYIFPLPR